MIHALMGGPPPAPGSEPANAGELVLPPGGLVPGGLMSFTPPPQAPAKPELQKVKVEVGLDSAAVGLGVEPVCGSDAECFPIPSHLISIPLALPSHTIRSHPAPACPLSFYPAPPHPTPPHLILPHTF